MDNLWNSIQSHNRGWILGISLWVGLGTGLAGCASLQHSLPVSGAAAVGAGIGAAACGPGCATIFAGAATFGTETLVPATEPLSSNPEIAKEQLKQDTIQDISMWVILGGVLLVIAAWLIPGPQITMPWRRKKDENGIQQ